jgi:DNA-binding LacI/PurR family transcriptional regulator
MDVIHGRTSTLDLLVNRLEQDIRRRGLGAGDRYLSAPEVARMLSVSTTTAHRAMQTLARRQMLVRRRNLGTFVGPHFEIKRGTTMRTVYAVMESPGLDKDAVPLESFIYGIRSRMKNANVQVTFLPRGDVNVIVRELLHSASAAGNVAGFVPISCPREVYRRLANSGIPTVVLGTPHVDQKDIASVDVDNRMAGQLLTQYLTGCGHRRIAVLMALEGQPGTNCFFDGVSDALTTAQLPHNALIHRIVPVEASAVASQLHELLAMPERPTALIARTPTMAKAVMAAFDLLQAPVADRCEIVYQNHPAVEKNDLPFTCVQPQLSFGEIIGRIGEMLERLGTGEVLDLQRVVIPVELCRRSSP